MEYQHIPPFYEYPHSRGEPCECLDCLEWSIIEAIEAAQKRRPHGTIRVRLKYVEPSKLDTGQDHMAAPGAVEDESNAKQ